MTPLKNIHYKRPDLDEYKSFCSNLLDKFAKKDLITQLLNWDSERKKISTMFTLNLIQFTTNTFDQTIKQEKILLDNLKPQFEEIDVHFITCVLDHPKQEILDERFGKRLRKIYQAKVLNFDPKIKHLIEKESQLCTAYIDLCSTASIEFQGEKHNLSTLAKFYNSNDRKERYQSRKAQHDFFMSQQNHIDDIFNDLVKVRHEKAKTLGYDNFIPLAYNLLNRFDYGPQEVKSFRDCVLRDVVPKIQELRLRQSKNIQVSKICFWDEEIFDMQGTPKPIGNSQFIIDEAHTVFSQLSEEVGQFYRQLIDDGLCDLESRIAKAGGGYCLSLDSFKSPFIFSNFNGTEEDVIVLIHECGHAFQYFLSSDQPIMDYSWPTLDACEIHSMSLVFLAFTWMEQFFGEQASRFCDKQIQETYIDLCNICLVDEFQHEVYANPHCSADERRRIWKNLEKKYQPWRQYEDLNHWSEGNYWHIREHIISDPFYYIDYGLASLCALQLYKISQSDFKDAINRYLKICRVGGSLSFNEIVKLAELDNPLNLNEIKCNLN